MDDIDVIESRFPVRIEHGEGLVKEAFRLAKKARGKETGGLLVGRIVADPNDPLSGLLCQPKALLHGKEGRGTSVRFELDEEELSRLGAQAAIEYPDMRVVGWWHSHPGHGIFYSSWDQTCHKSLFGVPGMVGLVVDPQSGKEGWFGCLREGDEAQSIPASLPQESDLNAEVEKLATRLSALRKSLSKQSIVLLLAFLAMGAFMMWENRPPSLGEDGIETTSASETLAVEANNEDDLLTLEVATLAADLQELESEWGVFQDTLITTPDSSFREELDGLSLRYSQLEGVVSETNAGLETLVHLQAKTEEEISSFSLFESETRLKWDEFSLALEDVTGTLDGVHGRVLDLAQAEEERLRREIQGVMSELLFLPQHLPPSCHLVPLSTLPSETFLSMAKTYQMRFRNRLSYLHKNDRRYFALRLFESQRKAFMDAMGQATDIFALWNGPRGWLEAASFLAKDGRDAIFLPIPSILKRHLVLPLKPKGMGLWGPCYK